MVVAGSAAGALLISKMTPSLGRRRALAVGYLIGVVGAAMVIVAGSAANVPLALAGSVLLGPANAAVFLSRYAGADLVAVHRRGRALGTILFAAAVGAVIGPNLLGPADRVTRSIGLARFSGLYLVSLVAFGVGAAILIRDRDHPRALPVDVHSRHVADSHSVRRSRAAVAVLAGANIAMVGIMAVVPVHLEAHHHGLTSIGAVISIHVVGMFVPAPLTGWLCDRFDPAWIAAAGGGVLFAAGLWLGSDDYAGTVATTGGLLVLGIGWNLAVVAGSTMLTQGIDGGRERLEAMGEVAMGAAAAVGAPSASFLASSSGWPTMTLVFGALGATAMFALTSPRRRAAGTATDPRSPSLPATQSKSVAATSLSRSSDRRDPVSA